MGRPRNRHTNAFGAWSKTLRFHIQKGQQPTEANKIADLGQTNMGDAKTLREFVRWGRDAYPAKRTMLVVWNHGQGWRKEELPEGAAPARPQSSGGGFRSVSNDDDTGDQLFNRAIQDELTALLAGERLDVIAFDACLMAMVETAYALRGVSKVMVASEELEPGSGWDYTSWLQPLVDSRGDVDALGLGRLLVKGMEATYGDLDATTLSSVSLDKVAALGSAISRFSDVAIANLSAETVAHFKAARAACANYAPGYPMHSIDLGLFMEQVAATSLPDSVRSAASEVLAALKIAVVDNYASAKRRAHYGSNGLAIYFPKTGFAHQRDADGVGYDPGNQHYPVEFVQAEKWAGFLRAYWQLVP
ncbi:MAG: hypothetical protein JNK04_17315 [Myxococcales bacterium]|nr:hypothetical protein [Myxococcales bacterium]